MSIWDAIGNFGTGVKDTMGKFGGKFMGENPMTAGATNLRREWSEEDRFAADSAREQSQVLGQALQQRALGQGGPSVAELQGQRGVAQAGAQAQQMAASARGVGRGSAFRQAMGAQAALGANAASQGAQLRAQEQIQAQTVASQHWQQQRMADLQSRGLGIREAEAQINAETAAMNANAQITEGEATRGQKGAGGILVGLGGLISDVRAKEGIVPLAGGAPGGQADWYLQQQRALMQQFQPANPQQADQAMLANALAKQSAPAPAPAAAPAASGGGGIGEALSGMGLSLSDRRAKDLLDTNASLRRELDAMRGLPGQIRGEAPDRAEIERGLEGPASVAAQLRGSTGRLPDVPPGYAYRYKPEVAAALGGDTQPQVGIMAQDALRSPLYRPAVVQMPGGLLGLDQGKLTQANAAALGVQNARLSQEEIEREKLRRALEEIAPEQIQKMDRAFAAGVPPPKAGPGPARKRPGERVGTTTVEHPRPPTITTYAPDLPQEIPPAFRKAFVRGEPLAGREAEQTRRTDDPKTREVAWNYITATLPEGATEAQAREHTVRKAAEFYGLHSPNVRLLDGFLNYDDSGKLKPKGQRFTDKQIRDAFAESM